ncbi:MAG: hypothetical protein ABFC34_05300 [Methanobacterium sp.]
MRLSKPAAPFERLDVRGGSITIDIDAKYIVIPTDNQYLLPGHNQWTESLNICDLVETPCGGLKNSIVQDKSPGALLIEGDGCYLQNVEGTYTGKSIGAGKLSETSNILDSGSTGIALATADGIAIKMMDGNLILLRPPSCIVEKFKVINISNIAATYAITVQCPDFVDSIKLYNIDVNRPEAVSFTKVGTSYIFSNSIASNSSKTLQVTIKYQSLEHTTEFTDDANTVIGLQNMSKSFIAIIPKTGKEVDVLSFTERPKSMSYKHESDGIISQITIFPGNGAINHSCMTHPDHSRVSGMGTVPDCLNKDIEGSVTKFLQSYGMKTDFASDATITTWVVPAISDTKILPLPKISDDLLDDEVNLRMSPGEYGCASFVVRSDKDVNLKIEASDLTYGENSISSENIDTTVVKRWWQDGYDATGINQNERGYRYFTPELLLHDNTLVVSSPDDWGEWNINNKNGKNYLNVNDEYIDISVEDYTPKLDHTITPISERNISDSNKIQHINIKKKHNVQFWINIHIPTTTISGIYTSTIDLLSNGYVLQRINFTVTVLPINLLQSNLTHSLMYLGKINYSGSISYRYKTIEQFTNEQLDLVRHGVSCPTLMYCDSYSSITDEILIKELQIRQACGIDNTTFYFYNTSALNINSPIETIQYYKNLLSIYGVENFYIYGLDETNLNTTDIRTKIDAIHDIGVKVFCGEYLPEYIENIADILDLVLTGRHPSLEYATLYHSYTSFDGEPHKIMSYGNPQTIPEYPRVFRLNYGFLLWQMDYDGVMDYAYQANMIDIWNDFDHPTYRDHVFAYPTANGVIDTIQWEGFREAVNDMRYLATLKAAISEANARGVMTTDIDSWLATVKTTDLTNANLDDIRSQMIDYILQLQRTENYVAVLMKNGKAILFKDGTQLFLEE